MSANEKHLEMVQAIINRLASNSYAYKGWAITVAAGLVVFFSDKQAKLVLVAIYPLLAFWMLDAYNLALERAFRKLYDQVRAGTCADYSMSLGDIRRPFVDQMNALLSWSTLAFYGSSAVFIGVVSRAVKQ